MAGVHVTLMDADVISPTNCVRSHDQDAHFVLLQLRVNLVCFHKLVRADALASKRWGGFTSSLFSWLLQKVVQRRRRVGEESRPESVSGLPQMPKDQQNRQGES